LWFQLKQLLPLVRPLHEFVLFLTIPFLDFADKLLAVSSDPLQVIIGELAILLFQFAFELHPFPLELIRIHGFPLQGEMALLQCSYRFGPVLHYISPAPARMARRPAAVWSRLYLPLQIQRRKPVRHCALAVDPVTAESQTRSYH
jgi:hypothetical protein